jgi:FMN phosphatase YigB (HAD superfamily)
MRVPYADIDTVLLDVGNTLISIDFDRVAGELAARQWSCAPEALRRAESAARPGYSERVFVTGVRPDRSLFHSYLSAILEKTDGMAALSPDQLDALVTDVAPILRPEGRANLLWRMVMPGVPDALARMQRQGLTLAVVSNSDGTCAASLEEAGLLHYMDFVIGDLYHADVVGGRGAGLHTLLLDPFDDWPPVLDCDRAADLSAVADRLESARANR